jgi:hypothetical protein
MLCSPTSNTSLSYRLATCLLCMAVSCRFITESVTIRIGLVARICRSQSSKDDQFRQGRGSIPRFGINLFFCCWYAFDPAVRNFTLLSFPQKFSFCSFCFSRLANPRDPRSRNAARIYFAFKRSNQICQRLRHHSRTSFPPYSALHVFHA